MMSGVDIAAIILAAGVVGGGAWDRVKSVAKDRREERMRLANGPEPICGCGHHLAYHDLHDGRCYAEVKRDQADAAATGSDVAASDSESGAAKPAPESLWRRCACRRYAGPEPIATVYAPQIARAGYEQSGSAPDVLDALDAPGPGD
jgi:hypothetical protein